jgi:hypothetical protein
MDFIKINFKLKYSTLIKLTVQNIIVKKTIYYYKPIITDRIIVKKNLVNLIYFTSFLKP